MQIPRTQGPQSKSFSTQVKLSPSRFWSFILAAPSECSKIRMESSRLKREPFILFYKTIPTSVMKVRHISSAVMDLQLRPKLFLNVRSGTNFTSWMNWSIPQIWISRQLTTLCKSSNKTTTVKNFELRLRRIHSNPRYWHNEFHCKQSILYDRKSQKDHNPDWFSRYFLSYLSTNGINS